MNRLIPILFCVIFSFALLASGCGSDDEPDTAVVAEKTFLQRAAAICERAEKEALEGAIEYAKGNPSVNDAKIVEPVLVPILSKQGEQIKALGLPRGNEAAVEAMNEEYERALEETERSPESILQPSTNPFDEYNRMAKENGVTSCSHIP